MTEHILALLVEERDKLNRAIEALGGSAIKRRGRPPKNPVAAVTPPHTVSITAPASTKHHMKSVAGRKAQSERMKAYWAAKRRKQSR